MTVAFVDDIFDDTSSEDILALPLHTLHEPSGSRGITSLTSPASAPSRLQTLGNTGCYGSSAGASRKRKCFDLDASETREKRPPTLDVRATSLNEFSSLPRSGQRLVPIIRSNWAYPKSQYQGWLPPLPITSESSAIKDLKQEYTRKQLASPGGAAHAATDDYVSFELSAFSMYRPSKPSNRAVWDERNYEYKMESLHQLNNKQGVSELLFDGILSVGQERRYVQGVPFKMLSIDGYGDHSAHTATGIWIQSSQGRQSAVWYQLRYPAEEYTRYHKPFLWVANLSKYFVDYLAEHDAVCLRDLRRRFYEQLVARHGSDEHFIMWLGESKNTDFRTSVAANAGFLFNESWNINTELTSHPIWGEIGPVELSAVPQQPQEEAKTIVTSYTYDCFKNMYFSKWLEARHPTNEVLSLQRRRQEALGFRPHGTSSHTPLNRVLPPVNREFRVGDVVGVNRDEESVWKDGQDTWFAYVQGTRTDTKGRQLLDVIWLYRPIDTTLSTMTYPVKNELFFSDHCNCDEHEFRAADVVCKVNVDWRPFSRGLYAQQDLQHDFIVRQVYRVGDNSFSTLRTTDFKCDCRTAVTQSELELLMTRFEVGDSVLFSSKGHDYLEPAVIESFLHEKGSVLMRRLPRRGRDLGHKEARPNEVVWTSSFFMISAK